MLNCGYWFLILSLTVTTYSSILLATDDDFVDTSSKNLSGINLPDSSSPGCFSFWGDPEAFEISIPKSELKSGKVDSWCPELFAKIKEIVESNKTKNSYQGLIININGGSSLSPEGFKGNEEVFINALSKKIGAISPSKLPDPSPVASPQYSPFAAEKKGHLRMVFFRPETKGSKCGSPLGQKGGAWPKLSGPHSSQGSEFPGHKRLKEGAGDYFYSKSVNTLEGSSQQFEPGNFTQSSAASFNILPFEGSTKYKNINMTFDPGELPKRIIVRYQGKTTYDSGWLSKVWTEAEDKYFSGFTRNFFWHGYYLYNIDDLANGRNAAFDPYILSTTGIQPSGSVISYFTALNRLTSISPSAECSKFSTAAPPPTGAENLKRLHLSIISELSNPDLFCENKLMKTSCFNFAGARTQTKINSSVLTNIENESKTILKKLCLKQIKEAGEYFKSKENFLKSVADRITRFRSEAPHSSSKIYSMITDKTSSSKADKGCFWINSAIYTSKKPGTDESRGDPGRYQSNWCPVTQNGDLFNELSSYLVDTFLELAYRDSIARFPAGVNEIKIPAVNFVQGSNEPVEIYVYSHNQITDPFKVTTACQ